MTIMNDKTVVQEKTNRLIKMTGEYCTEFLDSEYKQLSEKLILKMSRKRNVPFMSGKEEIWAAGTVYALGQINFLFDRNFEPHVNADSICNYFGTSKSTTSQKAKTIRDMFNMTYWDDEFSTERMKKNNPFDRIRDIIMGKEILENLDDMDEFTDNNYMPTIRIEDFDDDEDCFWVPLLNVVNFMCKDCKSEFDYNVGKVTFPTDQDRPSFEKEIHCPKCGIRTLDQIELTERGQTMLSDILFTAEIDNIDGKEYSDEELENVCDRIHNWGVEFSKSNYYKDLTEEQQEHSEGVIMFFTEYMYNNHFLPPEEWDVDSTEDCCIFILPTKVTAEISFFESISPVLTAFFNFLNKKKYLKNAAELAERVSQLNNEIVKMASDPNNWGMAKSLVMMAIEEGIDPTDEKEMQKFIPKFNEMMGNKAKKQSSLQKLFHKVGRNEPCPCGSGKKFKKCCGRT
jgi:hypothetical protein